MIFRCVFALLLVPLHSLSAVFATASSSSSECLTASFTSSPFQASASVACTNSHAESSAYFTPYDPNGDYLLRVDGSKDNDAPAVRVTAGIDDTLLVTGTDQSGYLLIRFLWERSLTIVAPYRIQSTGGSFMGQLFGAENPIRYVYVPFTAGVPVRIYGELYGAAGAWDSLQQNGDFSSQLHAYIRITSQVVPDPVNDNPMYIPDASYVAIPEPASWWLILSGLAALKRGSNPRASS